MQSYPSNQFTYFSKIQDPPYSKLLRLALVIQGLFWHLHHDDPHDGLNELNIRIAIAFFPNQSFSLY